MKPAAFEYFAPSSIQETVSLLSSFGDDCKILAGGQSLVPFLNFRMLRPACLIDINRVPELAYVRGEADGVLSIGAMTRHATLEHLGEDSMRGALFREVMPQVAHLQIRNRGTIGGSLSHADPAAELPAVAAALGATLRLVSQRGTRSLSMAEFGVGYLETALEPDELLAEISVPPLPAASGAAFVEVNRRHGDFALVGVAAIVALDERGRCGAVRIVLTGVGPTPFHADAGAALLVGSAPDAAALDEASHLATRDLEPLSDTHASAEYRRRAARTLVRQALDTASGRARAAREKGR